MSNKPRQPLADLAGNVIIALFLITVVVIWAVGMARFVMWAF